MKRRYIRIVIAGIIFLLALLLTLYPVISNLYNQEHQSLIKTEYEEVVAQTDTAEFDRIRKLAVAYNKAITPGTAGETYSQEAILAASEDYDAQLNLSGSGIMGYVKIPKIQVELPIYHGTGSDSLERGTGHLLGSSLPVGGESVHTIITGHSGMASQKMFTDLEQLEIGDVFYLHVLDAVLAYQVYFMEPVVPHDSSRLGIIQGKDLCTLITCYPTGVNTHRLLVQGERIPYEQAQEVQAVTVSGETEVESHWEDQYWLGIQMGLTAMICMVIVLNVILMVRKKQLIPKRKVGRYERT